MKHLLTAAWFVGLTSCGTILQPGGSEIDTSMEYEPPASWEAGIQFHFADSLWKGDPWIGERIYGAEVRFHDGRRERVVTGKELFYSSSSAIQTPWYRLWFPATEREVEPTLRVTIGDRAGNHSVANYPLLVDRDGFFRVVFAVYTPQPETTPWISPISSTIRVFDVPGGAKVLPSDSLRIGYHSVSRDCFNCPM